MNKILRLPEVMKITSLSRSSIYAFIKKGEFPRSINLGLNSVGWIEKEILSWVEEKIQMRGEAK